MIVKGNENRQHFEEAQQESMPAFSEASLNVLSLEQIRLIDDALSELGPFGEVRLIKAKGKLRFIQMLTSKSAL